MNFCEPFLLDRVYLADHFKFTAKREKNSSMSNEQQSNRLEHHEEHVALRVYQWDLGNEANNDRSNLLQPENSPYRLLT